MSDTEPSKPPPADFPPSVPPSEVFGSEVCVNELEKKREQSQLLESLNPEQGSGYSSPFTSRQDLLDPSMVTYTVQSKTWIRIFVAGWLFVGFLWTIEAVNLFFNSIQLLDKPQATAHLTATFFFFIKPAHMLWKLTQDISELEQERNNAALSQVLFSLSGIWKYAGRCVIAAGIYLLIIGLLSFIHKFPLLN